MKEKIKEVYERIQQEFIDNPFGKYNTKQYRKEFRNILEKELPKCFFICDETNNSQQMIDVCCIAVSVLWVESGVHGYCDILFGNHNYSDIIFR